MNCNAIFKVFCFVLRKVWEQQSRLGGKLQYKRTKLGITNCVGSCSRNKSFCFSISQPMNNCVRISVKKRTIRDYASSVLKKFRFNSAWNEHTLKYVYKRCNVQNYSKKALEKSFHGPAVGVRKFIRRQCFETFSCSKEIIYVHVMFERNKIFMFKNWDIRSQRFVSCRCIFYNL